MLVEPRIGQLISDTRYHCLFCDGYEERGQATVGVLGVGPIANVQRAVHLARMAHRLSQSVTIYTNGNTYLVDEIRSAVSDAQWLEVDARPITLFEKGEIGKTVILHFDDANTKQEGFLVSFPATDQQ
jgi:thioredoxin reductase